MPDNDSVDYFISATDDHGLDGASLAPGQTDVVSVADTNLIVTPDATPRPAPDGTSSIASGKVTTAKTITNRSPITITSSIKNADGSAGTDPHGTLIPDATDTIQVQAGLASSQGVLFGVPAVPTAGGRGPGAGGRPATGPGSHKP